MEDVSSLVVTADSTNLLDNTHAAVSQQHVSCGPDQDMTQVRRHHSIY